MNNALKAALSDSEIKSQLGRLAENIGVYRRRMEISQNELAQVLGISGSYIAQWETMRATPSVPMLIRLADLFNMEIDKMLVEDARSDEDVLRAALALAVANGLVGRARADMLLRTPEAAP